MLRSADDAELPSGLGAEFAENILDGAGDAESAAVIVRATGKEEPKRLGVGGVDDERARVSAVREAGAPDPNLIGEGLPVVALGFGAVFVVVDLDAQADGVDGGAGEPGGPAALGNPQLRRTGREERRRDGLPETRRGRGCRHRSVCSAAGFAELQDGPARIDRSGIHLGERRVHIGL